MRESVVSIGNSKGIRIPKAILKQCGIAGEVEISVEGRRIVLSPLSTMPRQGWREALVGPAPHPDHRAVRLGPAHSASVI